MKKIILGIVLLSTLVFGGQKFSLKSGDEALPFCFKKSDVMMADLFAIDGDKCFFIPGRAEPHLELIKKDFIPNPMKKGQFLNIYKIKVISMILQEGKRKTFNEVLWTIDSVKKRVSKHIK